MDREDRRWAGGRSGHEKVLSQTERTGEAERRRNWAELDERVLLPRMNYSSAKTRESAK